MQDLDCTKLQSIRNTGVEPTINTKCETVNHLAKQHKTQHGASFCVSAELHKRENKKKHFILNQTLWLPSIYIHLCYGKPIYSKMIPEDAQSYECSYPSRGSTCSKFKHSAAETNKLKPPGKTDVPRSRMSGAIRPLHLYASGIRIGVRSNQ